MTTPNASRSIDGTTSVTITLSAQAAERAHTVARYLVAGPLDSYPQPWNEIAPFGTKEIDQWLAGLVEMTKPGRALLEQFERAGVRDWSLEMQLALQAAVDRTGDDFPEPDPLPPATTGPVTITADADLLEELARALLDFNDHDHDDYEVENRAGASILVQLEAAR